MANGWIEPPPPQRGMGCFGKGCLILVVFIFVLIAAACVGFYWGFRHHSALVRGGYWLWKMKANVLADSPKEIPASKATDPEIQTVKERWQNFENSVEAHEPAEMKEHVAMANKARDLGVNWLVVNGEGTPGASRPFIWNGMLSNTLSRVAMIPAGFSAFSRPTTPRTNRVRFSNEPPYFPGRVFADNSSLSKYLWHCFRSTK